MQSGSNLRKWATLNGLHFLSFSKVIIIPLQPCTVLKSKAKKLSAACGYLFHPPPQKALEPLVLRPSGSPVVPSARSHPQPGLGLLSSVSKLSTATSKHITGLNFGFALELLFTCPQQYIHPPQQCTSALRPARARLDHGTGCRLRPVCWLRRACSSPKCSEYLLSRTISTTMRAGYPRNPNRGSQKSGATSRPLTCGLTSSASAVQ